jgi:hypothetical protein
MGKLPIHYKRLALALVRDLKANEGAYRRNEYTGDRYCVHGVNVGNPYGADLMCGYCEDGVSHYAFALGHVYMAWQRERNEFARQLATTVRDMHMSHGAHAFTSKELAGVYKAIYDL